MKIINKWVLILMLMFIPLLVIGCGSNLAGDKGVDKSDTSASGYSNRMDLAETKDDFLEIVKDSTATLANPSLPASEKSGILHTRAQAKLAADGVTLLGVVADLETLGSEEESDDAGGSTIFDSLDATASKTSTPNLRGAADDANRSSVLADGSVDSNKELDRGVMNLLVVNNMLTSVYDISEGSDGELVTEKQDDTQQNVDILDALFEPDEGESISTYFDNMDDAFGNTDILDEESDGEVDSMSTALGDLEELHTAIEEANGGITTISVNGEDVTVDTSKDDSDDGDNSIGFVIDLIFDQAFD